MCKEEGSHFIPFIMETFGAFGTKSTQLLKLIFNSTPSSDDDNCREVQTRAELMYDARAQLSIALQRGILLVNRAGVDYINSDDDTFSKTKRAFQHSRTFRQRKQKRTYRETEVSQQQSITGVTEEESKERISPDSAENKVEDRQNDWSLDESVLDISQLPFPSASPRTAPAPAAAQATTASALSSTPQLAQVSSPLSPPPAQHTPPQSPVSPQSPASPDLTLSSAHTVASPPTAALAAQAQVSAAVQQVSSALAAAQRIRHCDRRPRRTVLPAVNQPAPSLHLPLSNL